MQAEQEADISDGEIVEDENEESELLKKDGLKKLFTVEKLQKNFRKSNQKDESEEDINITKNTLERKPINRSLKDDKSNRHSAKKRRFEEYARKDFCGDRSDFGRNISSNRGFKRNKLSTSLKYTVSLPSISYAENPQINSIKNKKIPKKCSLEKAVKKDMEKIKQDNSPKLKTHGPLDDEKLSLTSPIKNSMDDTEKNSEIITNKNDFLCKESVPVVVESPPRSPVLQLPSTSNFTSSSLFREKAVRNVCSFLSDIESEGYLSSFSLLNDLDNDDQSDTEKKTTVENSNILSSTLDEDCQNKERVINSDEDDDTSSTSSSTSSDSSSTSSESDEESSDTSSNEDITPFSSGFGRFSSDSSLPFSVPLAEITKTTLEMQAKSLEISSISKPSLFTTAACIKPSQIALKTGLIAPNFAVPFKIYSIRDISAAQLSLPSVTSTLQISTEVKSISKESKVSERAREEKRSRKSRSRSLERRRSIDREVRNKKFDRRKSPPSMTKRRSISPPVAKRRSLTPPQSHKNRNFHLRHSSPPTRSRQRFSSHISSSKKFLQRPRSNERQRKQSQSPQGENSRSNPQKHKVFKVSERRDSPYSHERQSSDTATFSDDDSQASFRKHTLKLDSSEISHSNEDSNYNSFYYAQNYSENYQEDYFMPIEEQQYFDDFYSASKNFINNYNLVDITQQRRDRQRAESNQIAVQVGNVLEIVPNDEISQLDTASADINETIEIDPKELKEKRKIARDRKRKLKQIRKDGLRKEIQRYFDEGINIEDSEEEEFLIEPLKKSGEVIKSIIKSSCLQSKKDRRVVFSDGFYPFESSDHEESSFEEKLNRKTFRKSIIKKRNLAFITGTQKEGVESTKKQVEYYENVPPPSPPPGKPSEKLPQPKLKKISAELFASFPINLNPIYYFIQKIQHHHNGYNHVKGKGTLSARNLNTSDPRLMSSTTNCYSRYS